MGKSDLTATNANPGDSNSGAATATGTNPNQAGDSTGQAPNQAGNQSGTDMTALLSRLDSLDGTVTKLRQENAKYRTKLKGLASDDDGASKTGDNSEVNSEVAAQLQSLKDMRVRDQLTAFAKAEGAHYPDTIWKLVTLADVSDKDGTVVNPTKVIADLRKSYPHLFKPVVDGPGDGGQGGSRVNPANMSDRIRMDLRRLRGQTG